MAPLKYPTAVVASQPEDNPQEMMTRGAKAKNWFKAIIPKIPTMTRKRSHTAAVAYARERFMPTLSFTRLQRQVSMDDSSLVSQFLTKARSGTLPNIHFPRGPHQADCAVDMLTCENCSKSFMLYLSPCETFCSLDCKSASALREN